MIPYAKQIVKERKVTQIGKTLFDVMGHSVKFQVKKGRTLLICDCKNDTDYCNESPICSHKLAVIIYLINFDLDKRLNETIKIYEEYKKLKRDLPLSCFIDELKELRRLK